MSCGVQRTRFVFHPCMVCHGTSLVDSRSAEVIYSSWMTRRRLRLPIPFLYGRRGEVGGQHGDTFVGRVSPWQLMLTP
jgi:hypothetical protein